MRGIKLARRAMFLGLALALALGQVANPTPAEAGDPVLKDPRPVGGAGSLADIGVRQLERLPWPATVVRFNLGRDRPVSISACYLMRDDLLIVSAAGRIYCVSRRDGTPRWVASLRHRLAKPPADGASDYAFLTKDLSGACWVEVFSKRSGAPGDRFPKKLPYAAASAIGADGSMVYVPSLGRPGHNMTVETVSLVSARSGWGFAGTGMVLGGAHVDPKGDLVVFASDDGVVTALEASAEAPKEESWSTRLSGAIDAGLAVTPAHVVAATHDGLVYCLDLSSGETRWMRGADQPFRRRAPWVIGRTKRVARPAGVEGAKDVMVDEYQGVAFARNVKGLHAWDLQTGTPLFTEKAGGRPILTHGKWVLTMTPRRQLVLRDKTDGYKPKAQLGLRAFDLVPTNRDDGTLFACTADGSVVLVVPK